MKLRLLLYFLFIILTTGSQAQNSNGFVGIGTSSPKAKLQISSDSSGILIPKYATLAAANSQCLPNLTQANHSGLMIYVDEASNRGFWFYDGTAFSKVGGSSTQTGHLLQLSVTKNVTQTTALGNNSSLPDLITFESTNSGTLTGGNSWSNNVFTIGSEGAGLYYIENYVIADIATFVIPMIDMNNTGNSGSSIYGTSYSNTNTLQTPHKARGYVSSTLYLTAGNTIRIRAASGSTVTGVPLSTDGTTKLTIIKLN